MDDQQDRVVVPDTVEGSVRTLGTDIGLPIGFLEGLRAEDDWSFIIKVHALIEAAVSHLLCSVLGKATLHPR